MAKGSKISELTVPLQAETLDVSRRINLGDTVRVQTVTHQRHHRVDEALRSETVEVARIPVGREITVVPEVFQDGDLTIIPVVEEVVVVTRKLILKEEIHLRHVRTTARHQETVVLRAQEAIITREAPPEQAVPKNQPKPKQET